MIEQTVMWRSRMTLSDGRGARAVALHALDQLVVGLIVTDGRVAAIEMNRAGEPITQLENGLRIRNHRLCARRGLKRGAGGFASCSGKATAGSASRLW